MLLKSFSGAVQILLQLVHGHFTPQRQPLKLLRRNLLRLLLCLLLQHHVRSHGHVILLHRLLPLRLALLVPHQTMLGQLPVGLLEMLVQPLPPPGHFLLPGELSPLGQLLPSHLAFLGSRLMAMMMMMLLGLMLRRLLRRGL